MLTFINQSWMIVINLNRMMHKNQSNVEESFIHWLTLINIDWPQCYPCINCKVCQRGSHLTWPSDFRDPLLDGLLRSKWSTLLKTMFVPLETCIKLSILSPTHFAVIFKLEKISVVFCLSYKLLLDVLCPYGCFYSRLKSFIVSCQVSYDKANTGWVALLDILLDTLYWVNKFTFLYG